jgi:hypothetical protein
LANRLLFGNPSQDDPLAIGKLGDQGEVSAHRRDGFA